MTNAFSELFKHNLWANLQLLDVCERADHVQLEGTVQGTYGPIRDTFVHLLAAEGRYVALLSDQPADQGFNERTGFRSWDELRERAQTSGPALIAIAEAFDAERVLRGTRGGQAYAIRAIVPMIQAINHATEHRTHITTILTQQGITPPEIDGWQYGDQMLAS